MLRRSFDPSTSFAVQRFAVAVMEKKFMELIDENAILAEPVPSGTFHPL